jgi:predicted membrane-bound dolichyl-phosphate-mannose-protein mannosyltransferase
MPETIKAIRVLIFEIRGTGAYPLRSHSLGWIIVFNDFPASVNPSMTSSRQSILSFWKRWIAFVFFWVLWKPQNTLKP